VRAFVPSQYNVGTQTRRAADVAWHEQDLPETHPRDTGQSHDKVVAAIEMHLRRFWDPCLRAGIIAHSGNEAIQLDPTAREAVARPTGRSSAKKRTTIVKVAGVKVAGVKVAGVSIASVND